MKMWYYLLLILIFVIGILYYFSNRIIMKILKNRMAALTKEGLDLDNTSAFAGINLKKLKDTVESLSDGTISESDPKLKEQMKSMVESLSYEFEMKLKQMESNHDSDVKKQEVKQAEANLDSIFKNLSHMLDGKNGNVKKVLKRLEKDQSFENESSEQDD